MPEPITVNCLFTTPNTGDLVGSWGTAAINPIITALDGRLGGVTSISLSNASVTLTQQAGTATPGAGPTQCDNAVIKLSGTLSANCVVTFPLPGVYVVRNDCTVGSFYVQARAAGTGNLIGIPEGKSSKVWNDGTNMDFVDPPEVGSYLDLAASTTPKWMGACTVKPYLICDGTVYTSNNFTALSARLGSTYGGNGSTTFGVPDLRGRYRLPLDNQGGSAAGRVTNAISGVNATTLGASGGSQSIQAHTHTATVTDPGHTHPVPSTSAASGSGASSLAQIGSGGAQTIGTASTGVTVSNSTTGSGGSQNMPPTLVAGIALIKT